MSFWTWERLDRQTDHTHTHTQHTHNTTHTHTHTQHTHTDRQMDRCIKPHTHTHHHTHMFVFVEKWGHPIGVMVFILYKLYVLLPYTYPTPKLSPHRRLCISTFPKKPHSVWFISVLKSGGTWVNVLKSHLHLVIPVSYLCHYTNLCPDLSQKRAQTHTHTHTHTTHTHTLVFVVYGDSP